MFMELYPRKVQITSILPHLKQTVQIALFGTHRVEYLEKKAQVIDQNLSQPVIKP